MGLDKECDSVCAGVDEGRGSDAVGVERGVHGTLDEAQSEGDTGGVTAASDGVLVTVDAAAAALVGLIVVPTVSEGLALGADEPPTALSVGVEEMLSEAPKDEAE